MKLLRWAVRRSFAIITLAGLVVLAASATSPPSVAQVGHPAQPPGAGPHQDLFRSSKPETARVDWDPRFKPEVRYSAIGDQAIIQGDIVIGKLADVRKRNLYSWAEEARRIDPDDPALGLTKEQKDVLDGLRSIRVPDDVAKASKNRQRSLALRVINELVRYEEVGKAIEGYPTAAVGAYKKVQRGSPTAASEIQIGQRYRWPKGVIPYKVDGDLPDLTLIASAIDHWHTMTDRIHLRPASAGDADYVRFVLGAGCSSAIGRIGGEQIITLTSGCERPQVIHEIGHAVGLWHEQCRNDRDNFLIVHDENVDPDMLHNFDLAGPQGQDVGRFDFKSIMLYPKWAFSDNGQATVESRFPGVGEFGVGSPGIDRLSEGDLEGVRIMYVTPASPPNPKHVTPPVAAAAPPPPVTPVPIPNLRDQSPRVLPPLGAPRR